jgi:hypothetical protein
MYEKAIFFFEIRKNPLKTGDFLKNLPRFSSKKIRAAAQKFPKTPSIQKNFPALGRCDDLVTGQCMAKLLNVTFLALAYFFQFYMAYWEHFTKRVFGSKSRKVGRTPPPNPTFSWSRSGLPGTRMIFTGSTVDGFSLIPYGEGSHIFLRVRKPCRCAQYAKNGFFDFGGSFPIKFFRPERWSPSASIKPPFFYISVWHIPFGLILGV